MPRWRRSSSQRPTSATVPASTPTTRRLPPLPRCTTSVPASGSKSFAFSASASPSRSPQRHSTAISALFRIPVGALLEQRRISSSISPAVSRSASSLEPFPRPTRASSSPRHGPYGPGNQRCPPAGAIAPLVWQARPARTGGALWCCRSRQCADGRGAGHAGRAARVALGRARPPGDRAQPRTGDLVAFRAEGKLLRVAAVGPDTVVLEVVGAAKGDETQVGTRTETTLRDYLEAWGEGTFSAPSEGSETPSSAAPPTPRPPAELRS